uniref:hypothetical protein n=1 Tax=Purpureocillium takamizusanense TaxID=2060973 RepID=UPI001FA72F7F|nr:hypothetical protein MRV25_mgp17 [Purpureocillium takamizusanense]UNI92576.1 hypothetical protein [Purpureocillium takamizusanense]
MTILNNSIECDLWNVSKLSKSMNIDKFYIFSIVIDETFECKVTETEQVKYVEIGFKYFIENYLENSNNTDFWKHNKNTLYILRNSNYSDVREMFTIIQETKVRLVRGSSQKSHIISPIDFRLSSYLIILFNMDFNKINAENSFNTLSKDRYLPSSM